MFVQFFFFVVSKLIFLVHLMLCNLLTFSVSTYFSNVNTLWIFFIGFPTMTLFTAEVAMLA